MVLKGGGPKGKWDARYGAADYEPNTTPVPFLASCALELEAGKALCLAAGAGRNAVFLAEHGFAVTAVDISARGLEWCRRLAEQRNVEVETVEADALSFDAATEQWDLVTNLYFHEPELFGPMQKAVKSGGHYLFQTYTRAQLQLGWGPSNPDHLVEPAQLRQTFSEWHLISFAEVENAVENGRREAVVQMLARKPK